MRLASDLLGCRLESESGDGHGRVYDIRARRDGDRWRVVGLVVGPRGLLERLGVTNARREEPIVDGDLFAWEDVVALEDGRVIVRDGARPR